MINIIYVFATGQTVDLFMRLNTDRSIDMKLTITVVIAYTLALLITGAMILNSAAPKLQVLVTALEIIK